MTFGLTDKEATEIHKQDPLKQGLKLVLTSLSVYSC